MKYNFDYIDPPTYDVLSATISKCSLVRKVLKVEDFFGGILSPFKFETDDPSVELFDCQQVLQYNINSNVIYPSIKEVRRLNLSVVNNREFGVVWLGCIYDCWGHYITDALSKAWYLLEDQWRHYKANGYKLAIGFFFSNKSQCPASLLSLYKLLNVEPKDIIIVDSPMRFTHIVVPENSLFIENRIRCYTKEFRKTIDYITSKVPLLTESKYEKIYLSRRHIVGHGEFGEGEIERVFKKLGYTIVHPEEMSVEQQIAMLQSTRSFVATSGSLGHNAIFCKPHTEVIILRKMHAVFDYQLVINSLKELNVTYIDCHLSCFVNDQPNSGPFYIYLSNNLVRFIYDRYEKKIRNNFSWSHYSKYIRACCLRPDMKMRNNAPEYYYELLNEEIHNHSIRRKLYIYIRPFVSKRLLTIIVNKFK